jgi:hypothetical protein
MYLPKVPSHVQAELEMQTIASLKNKFGHHVFHATAKENQIPVRIHTTLMPQRRHFLNIP